MSNLDQFKLMLKMLINGKIKKLKTLCLNVNKYTDKTETKTSGPDSRWYEWRPQLVQVSKTSRQGISIKTVDLYG